jgi:hypothetical protein
MMQPEIVVGILSLIGTCTGSLAGVMASSKLANYRIDQLEKKVDKHNNLIERMVRVEGSSAAAHERIDDLYKLMDVPDKRETRQA